MYADNIFRICLIVSISLHLGLVFPWPFLNLLSKRDESLQKIELSYLPNSKITEVKVRDIAPAYQHESEPNITKKPSADTAKSKAADTAKLIETDPQKEKIEIPKDTGAKKEEKSENASQVRIDSAGKIGEAVDISTLKGAVYEKYYLDVRDKIKAIIEKNKRGLLKESEICVRFMIDRRGNLKDIRIYKSSDSDVGNLEKLAIKSIREAAPFQPFSDKMKENELQFNLPVRVIRKY